MILKVLIDTCVWLDLAKDYRQQPVISALEDMVESGEVVLLVPHIVLDEFRRNKERVAADAKRSLQSHFSLVRDAVNRFANEAEKEATLKALNQTDHAAVFKGQAVNASIDRIESLLVSVPSLPITDVIKARVTDRAIAQQAPYHRPKNSVADAVIIETYAEHIALNNPPMTFSLVRSCSGASKPCFKCLYFLLRFLKSSIQSKSFFRDYVCPGPERLRCRASKTEETINSLHVSSYTFRVGIPQSELLASASRGL